MQVPTVLIPWRRRLPHRGSGARLAQSTRRRVLLFVSTRLAKHVRSVERAKAGDKELGTGIRARLQIEDKAASVIAAYVPNSASPHPLLGGRTERTHTSDTLLGWVRDAV